MPYKNLTLQLLISQAKAFVLAGNWGKEAIECNSNIIELDNQNSAAHKRLARCYIERRDFHRAKETYEKVLVFDPKNRIALNGLISVKKELAEKTYRPRWVGPKKSQNSPIHSIIQKYQADQTGIRHNIRMRYVCIACGSFDVREKSEEEPYYKVCQNCHATWYINSCWNCSDGLIDSRDSETPQCPICGWYKCQSCGACNLHGCSTNPYHEKNRLKDLKNKNTDDTPAKNKEGFVFNSYQEARLHAKKNPGMTCKRLESGNGWQVFWEHS